MHECLARGGGIRLLIVIDAGFDRFEAGALWEDLKFGLGPGLELSRWERMALVSDAGWVHHAISLFGWLVPGDVRVFPLVDEADAVELAEGLTPQLRPRGRLRCLGCPRGQ